MICAMQYIVYRGDTPRLHYTVVKVTRKIIFHIIISIVDQPHIVVYKSFLTVYQPWHTHTQYTRMNTITWFEEQRCNPVICNHRRWKHTASMIEVVPVEITSDTIAAQRFKHLQLLCIVGYSPSEAIQFIGYERLKFWHRYRTTSVKDKFN